MFYIVCNSFNDRVELINQLKSKGILAVFHYLSLHKSTYFQQKHDIRELIESDKYSECLLRLPFFFELNHEEIELIIKNILEK